MVRQNHKSKSHRAIKDPEKQKAKREAKFKNKVKNIDDIVVCIGIIGG